MTLFPRIFVQNFACQGPPAMRKTQQTGIGGYFGAPNVKFIASMCCPDLDCHSLFALVSGRRSPTSRSSTLTGRIPGCGCEDVPYYRGCVCFSKRGHCLERCGCACGRDKQAAAAALSNYIPADLAVGFNEGEMVVTAVSAHSLTSWLRPSCHNHLQRGHITRHRRNIRLLQRVVCGNRSFQLMHQDDRNHQRVESIVINTSLANGQLLQAWKRRRTLYDERFQRVYRPCTSNFKLRD